MNILRAAAAVEYLKAHKLNDNVVKFGSTASKKSEHDVICTHCFRTGTIDIFGQHPDREFLYHALEQNHTLFVRLEEPHELFCMSCGDYAYSNLFDYLTKRTRATGGDAGGRFLLEDKIVAQMGKRCVISCCGASV